MAIFISTILRSYCQATEPRECRYISSLDIRSVVCCFPLTIPPEWPFLWVITGLSSKISVWTSVRKHSRGGEHYHQKAVSDERKHSTIQLAKRDIIRYLALSDCSFHIDGFLPVSSTVPANYKVLWLSVTHVNIEVVFWHQIHIVENETVPVLFF